MKKNLKFTLTLLIAVSLSILAINCGGTGGGGGGGIVTTVPTWITASWSGGTIGNPNDRTDTEATEWDGSICPASSVGLTNYSVGDVLNIVNSCTLTVTYAICVSKGSLAQPEGGLEECATDPFDTSFSQLTFKTITNGVAGDFINSTQNLSINIFYCSDEQTLITGPIRCL